MKPEITWTVCPTCDVKRPFFVEYEDDGGECLTFFRCLGCGDYFDDEGNRLNYARETLVWRRICIRACYEYYREEHDQFRRYPQPKGI